MAQKVDLGIPSLLCTDFAYSLRKFKAKLPYVVRRHIPPESVKYTFSGGYANTPSTLARIRSGPAAAACAWTGTNAASTNIPIPRMTRFFIGSLPLRGGTTTRIRATGGDEVHMPVD